MTRLLAVAFLAATPLLAQTPEPRPTEAPATPRPTPLPPVVSPEIAGGRVTFRLRHPAAKEVLLSGEWSRERTPMTKDERGDWTATLAVEPGVWCYSYIVDGFQIADPVHSQLKLARSPRTSVVDVPSDPPRVDEFQDVPHGTVRLHTYVSKSLGRRRPLTVYTPAAYDKEPARKFPVFYMLHGAGDNEQTWISPGRAHYILDNVIAKGQAVPMILVMIDSHPVYPTPAGERMRNAEALEADLVGDVIPFVEASYRVQANARGRALTGVSMGGGQALLIGLRHPDVFGWILGLSGADPELPAATALADAKLNDRLALLYVACAKTDNFIEANRKLVAALAEKGVAHTFDAHDGAHNWPQWRRYLAQVTPLLFTEAKPQRK